jgi:16S rRNA U516 pseudouridylate synthase RsuA-like enzyme
MPEFTIQRNEKHQREYSIQVDGKPAIKGVRFATEREANLVLKALMSALESKDFLESVLNEGRKEEPKQVPNQPQFHESVQAVRGQTPRA